MFFLEIFPVPKLPYKKFLYHKTGTQLKCKQVDKYQHNIRVNIYKNKLEILWHHQVEQKKIIINRTKLKINTSKANHNLSVNHNISNNNIKSQVKQHEKQNELLYHFFTRANLYMITRNIVTSIFLAKASTFISNKS